MPNYEQSLVDALGLLDEDGVIETTRSLIDGGVSPSRIEELLQQGMLEAEKRYEEGEYFLGDLIVAGTLFIEALKMLPEMDAGCEGAAGKVMIGVVSEDIHDIGKDIVVQVLKSWKFNVLDLGVDVSPERYVAEVELFKPDIVALSGVMGTSPHEMKRVIELMESRGLRDDVAVIIGGACANERVCEIVGADAYAEGPVDTAKLCKQYMDGRQRA